MSIGKFVGAAVMAGLGFVALKVSNTGFAGIDSAATISIMLFGAAGSYVFEAMVPKKS